MRRAAQHIKAAAGTGSLAHICVDIQRMFLQDTPWTAPWARRIHPRVCDVARAFRHRTIFTRFMPPERWEDDTRAWRSYFHRWRNMTREWLAPEYLDIDAELMAVSPAAPVIGRARYSAWSNPEMAQVLHKWEANAVVVTGCETDMCVLATVLGAIDNGLFVVLTEDAVCGSVDETHDAMLEIFRRRYSEHLVVLPASAVVELADRNERTTER